jgi:DMSO/TMAO reductase YedYZ molybdopterin-dependent catalytic subunit
MPKVRSPLLAFLHTRFALSMGVAIALYLTSPATAQSRAGVQSAAPPRLQIAGDVQTPLSLSLTDIRSMRHVGVELRSEDGRTVVYDGVPVAELLTRAGAPLGAALRGAALTA